MKQDDVAQAAGITRPMLSAYERGRVQPTLDTLDRLLGALECDLTALSQALKIVNSMGKVGRKPQREGEAAAGPARGEEDPGAHRGLILVTDHLESGNAKDSRGGRTPFQFGSMGPLARHPLDPDEEHAFQQLLEVQRRWLVALRQSMIRQMQAESLDLVESAAAAASDPAAESS